MAAPASHGIAADDRQFLADFESGGIAPAAFTHRSHLRLAYTILAAHDDESAIGKFRAALLGFVARHGIDPAKYHETLTRAWLMAVRHFMDRAGATGSFEEFIAREPRLLDSSIMMTHYSKERLSSPEARAGFMPPDREPIPARRQS